MPTIHDDLIKSIQKKLLVRASSRRDLYEAAGCAVIDALDQIEGGQPDQAHVSLHTPLAALVALETVAEGWGMNHGRQLDIQQADFHESPSPSTVATAVAHADLPILYAAEATDASSETFAGCVIYVFCSSAGGMLTLTHAAAAAMDVELPLTHALPQGPADQAHALADWLESHGESDAAEQLRHMDIQLL